MWREDTSPGPDESELVDDLAQAVGRLEERVSRLEEAAALNGHRAHRQRVAARLEQGRGRLRHWRQPRLGVPLQHPPGPLMVSPALARTRPPARAPSIAIVTPSYRQNDYVARTIESILAQRYPALEYVVQDGGSDDGSAATIEHYSDLLTRWESAPDGGHADAVNRGFRGTTGEIMAWVNSDDMLLPGSLAYVARYFADHPEIDLVYGHRVMVDGTDSHVGSWIVPPHDDEVLGLVDYVPQETMFWRRRLWERAGGHLDERYQFALDWELLLRFRAAGARMVRLPRLLGAFRWHDRQKNQTLLAESSDELTRLRDQANGRRISRRELERRTRGYLQQHIALHTAHRLRERLPLPRIQALPDMRLDAGARMRLRS